MIHIKSEKELERMRVAGRITALARKAAADAVHPGVTTEEIDRIVRKTIEDAGAKPSFLGYGGFPGSACVSINDEVIHGIPSKTHIVREGDIVKVDVGAYIGGYHGDCAATIPCGEVSDEAKKLIAVTRQSFFEGIKFARVGYRVSDIGAAVQAYVEANGFSVVRDYVGHGVCEDCKFLIRVRRCHTTRITRKASPPCVPAGKTVQWTIFVKGTYRIVTKCDCSLSLRCKETK